MNLVKFATWAEVLAHAAERKPLYYQAPLDRAPTRLVVRRVPTIPELRKFLKHFDCTYEPRPRTIRIWPPGSVGRGAMRTSDPFTADAGHLDRFSADPGYKS